MVTTDYSGTISLRNTSIIYIGHEHYHSYSRVVTPKPKPDPKKKNKKFWHKFNSYRMDGKF